MKVFGRIVEVMESYPPQLIVDVDGRNCYVELTEMSQVTKEGKIAEFGILRPNLNIVIEGELTGNNDTAMTATNIKLL